MSSRYGKLLVKSRRQLLKCLGLLGLGAATPATPATWVMVTGGAGLPAAPNQKAGVRETPSHRGKPIAMGANFAVLRRADGSIWATGSNNKGQLGQYSLTPAKVNLPIPVNTSSIEGTAVAAGDEFWMMWGTYDSSRPYGVGDNASYQLGNSGAYYSYPQPVYAKADDAYWIRTVACGAKHSLFIKSYRTSTTIAVWQYIDTRCSGIINLFGLCILGSWYDYYDWVNQTVFGQVYAAGSNVYGENFSNEATPADKRAIFVSESMAGYPKECAGGGNHSAIVRADGVLLTAGLNSSGQLGSGNTTNYSSYTVSGLSGVDGVACGDAHTVALIANGTVYATGRNTSGQLGRGSTGGNASTFVLTTGISNAVAVAAGNNHTLFLTAEGKVYACGDNTYGQLGDNSTTVRNSPVQVPGMTNITVIEAGGNSSMALRSDGVVFAWGNNADGQLGDGSYTNRSTPVQMLL